MERTNCIEIRFPLHTPSRRAARGSTEVAPPAAGQLPRVTRVLALAIQFQEMLRTGEVRDCADLARLAGVTRERISQIMKLRWLAPDIQMEVLYFQPVSGVYFPIRERALRIISNRLGWEEQRTLWSNLKQTSHLS
jgi:integrase